MTAPAPAGTLFLVRHGRTAANGSTYVGWADPPLDAEGAAQAARVRAALGDEPLDAVFSSPLRRAIATAEPLARARRLEIRVRPQLAEIHYGEYQGLAKDARPLRLRREHRTTPMPRGESLLDLHRRVGAFAAELAALLRAGGRALVVGHYWSNRMLVGWLQGLPFDAVVDAPAYKPANGSVLEVRCEATAAGLAVRGAALRALAEVTP